MEEAGNTLLLLVLLVDLYAVSTSRIQGCIRASALHGVLLAALPGTLHGHLGTHALVIGLGTLAVKALFIPHFLMRALRQIQIHREVEPYVSQHGNLLVGTCLVAFAFWLAQRIPVPHSTMPTLLVAVALATFLLGFFLLVSRRKALTQVVGYLMVENGVFLFGLNLAGSMPLVVELGILLDVFVSVFVFGIILFHIREEFDHIDTDVLRELAD